MLRFELSGTYMLAAESSHSRKSSGQSVEHREAGAMHPQRFHSNARACRERRLIKKKKYYYINEKKFDRLIYVGDN